MSYEYNVFISYHSSDRDWVKKLKNALVEVGITVWMDKDEIRGGDRFAEAIEEGLKKSRTTVFVISQETLDSFWVKQEYYAAISLNSEDPQRRIIPLLLRDAKLQSSFLQIHQWIDFRDEAEFESSLQKLIEGIECEWVDTIGTLPKVGSRPLNEIMLEANRSLIISGHTLDKFAHDRSVKNALVTLFERGTHVMLILLNPYSDYAKAHEPFHTLESRGKPSAHDQIMSTIKFFEYIFNSYTKPENFEVILTNYMPRFRTILIDNEICHINLYMYGKDVVKTPEFRLLKTTEGISSSEFEAIRDSVHQMIESSDIIHLIKDGRFNKDWGNIKVANILNNFLETSCGGEEYNSRWNTVQNVILGYQDGDSEIYRLGICDQKYKPGTYTIGRISRAAEFLEPQTTFDEWVNNVLEDEFNLINESCPKLFERYSRYDLSQKVKKALDFNPVGDEPLKCKIWCQEYSDILRRLAMTFLASNPDFDLEINLNLTRHRQDFMFEVLEWLKESKELSLKDWLHLSVAAGLLGIDEKPSHAAASNINPIKGIILDRPDKDRKSEVKRVGNELLDAAKSPCRIDATNLFFHRLGLNKSYIYKIVSFPDDYLETIILLKFYEELLKQYPKLEIDFVPKSIRCANDATYEDVLDFLKRFPFLQNERRFRLVENGPKIGGLNLQKLHKDIVKLIDKASVLDVRGARSYEMMQGVNKEAYFSFMGCRDISESVTGLISEKRPFIFLHQGSGEHSFEGFTNRHKRREDGRMFAEVTANDQKYKWEGGYLEDFDRWSHNRKQVYKINWEFYNKRVNGRYWRGRERLELEVQKFLDEFLGRVLVIGCGTGKEVQYLSEKGCNVLGFDFSPEAIHMAQTQYPKLKNCFSVEDLYNIDIFRSGEFDGIVANAVLVHLLDREDMYCILEKIWKRLKEDGLCFIRVLEKESFDYEVDHHQNEGPRWFVYYSEKELKSLAEKAGFEVVCDHKRERTRVSDVYWISALLRKSGKPSDAL